MSKNKQTYCKSCGQVIEFIQTLSGKWTPINSDGTSHWATCPDAQKFKKR